MCENSSSSFLEDSKIYGVSMLVDYNNEMSLFTMMPVVRVKLPCDNYNALDVDNITCLLSITIMMISV
jgi:hypothetical protein